jgi:hypothetical protein
MVINSIDTTAVRGIQRGFQGVRRAAGDIARGVGQVEGVSPPTDFARSMVEMKQGGVQVQASARALKAYDNSLGRVIDMFV